MRLSPSESGSFRFVPLHEAVARQQPVASAGGVAGPGGLGCRAFARPRPPGGHGQGRDAARNDHRVPVSADTDFGALLAASHDPGPSIVLVRRVVGRRVEELAGILIANLPQVEEDLRLGSIVVIGDDTLRISRLPIG
jgi:uncharacterized protein DUF5615